MLFISDAKKHALQTECFPRIRSRSILHHENLTGTIWNTGLFAASFADFSSIKRTAFSRPIVSKKVKQTCPIFGFFTPSFSEFSKKIRFWFLSNRLLPVLSQIFSSQSSLHRVSVFISFTHWSRIFKKRSICSGQLKIEKLTRNPPVFPVPIRLCAKGAQWKPSRKQIPRS